MYTDALKLADAVVPTTTSSWLYQQLDMHSTLQPHLARGFSLFCLAEGHHTLQQGATGEESK